MKPWTEYTRSFATAAEFLRRQATPARFGRLDQAMEWIADLRFVAIISADLECERLSRAVAAGKPATYRQTLGQDDLRWELILRCQCALAFCQGKVENHGDFDWTQKPEAIYRFLLIEFWRKSALRWAKSSFSSRGYAEAKATSAKVGKLVKKLVRTNPSHN